MLLGKPESACKNTMPESRFLDTAKVRVRFIPPSEGGREIPPGDSYVGLVRFDGEEAPTKHMQLIFDAPVNPNGFVEGKIRFNGIGTRGLLSQGKAFVYFEGGKIVARGTVINNNFELPKGLVFVSTGNLRTGTDPFED